MIIRKIFLQNLAQQNNMKSVKNAMVYNGVKAAKYSYSYDYGYTEMIAI